MCTYISWFWETTLHKYLDNNDKPHLKYKQAFYHFTQYFHEENDDKPTWITTSPRTCILIKTQELDRYTLHLLPTNIYTKSIPKPWFWEGFKKICYKQKGQISLISHISYSLLQFISCHICNFCLQIYKYSLGGGTCISSWISSLWKYFQNPHILPVEKIDLNIFPTLI